MDVLSTSVAPQSGLAGQSVVVFGGSSGIGAEIARRSLDQGALVCVASHTAEKLDAIRSSLGDAVRFENVDVGDEEEVAAFCQRLGTVDHVVFCAEAVQRGEFKELSTSIARRNFEVKFWGAYAVAKYVRLAPTGSLTLFSGVISRMPFQRVVPVSVINAALEALTRGLAFELAPIRVNCISPGTIDTPAWLHLPQAQREAMFEQTRRVLPLQRLGEAANVADVALMVMGNAFMTGTVLDIDGGALLGNPPT